MDSMTDSFLKDLMIVRIIEYFKWEAFHKMRKNRVRGDYKKGAFAIASTV